MGKTVDLGVEMQRDGVVNDAKAGTDFLLQAADDGGVGRARARVALDAQSDGHAAAMGPDEGFGELFVAEVIGRPKDRPSFGDGVDPSFENVAKVPRCMVRTPE